MVKKHATKKAKKAAKAIVTKQAEEVRARHEFIGSHEGAVVVLWMNDPNRPANDAVEQLIALEVRRQSGGFENLEVGQAMADFINKTVARWKLGTAPVADWNQTDGLTVIQRSKADMKNIPPAQSLAFGKALELMGAGLLTRVRRCKLAGCGQWFFAVFDHAVYHTEDCRIQATATSPAFRERRKLYMRTRRKKG